MSPSPASDIGRTFRKFTSGCVDRVLFGEADRIVDVVVDMLVDSCSQVSLPMREAKRSQGS